MLRSLIVNNAAFWGTSYCPRKFIFSITRSKSVPASESAKSLTLVILIQCEVGQGAAFWTTIFYLLLLYFLKFLFYSGNVNIL